MVLATDLDGTFFGGTAKERASLYDYLGDRRDEITVIYVTGRDYGHIREQITELPEAAWPDHVVGNVGTTAATCTGAARTVLEPLLEVERWLDSRWSASAPQEITAILERHPHLHLQPVFEGRRVSYFFTDAAQAQAAALDIEAAGFDALISDNRFFDVLPRGVSKGPTLLRVLKALAIDPLDVLVAGDTLNDLSLFETGLRGVAVGNSEPALLAAVADMPHVTRATSSGAAGILQVLQAIDDERRA